MPKYSRERAFNEEQIYQELFDNRGRDYIEQYRAKVFTKDLDALVPTVEHVWRKGDHFFKLAGRYYGDTTYWWVIAFWNNVPTEAHLNYGDYIYIPTSLSAALKAFGEQ